MVSAHGARVCARAPPGAPHHVRTVNPPLSNPNWRRHFNIKAFPQNNPAILLLHFYASFVLNFPFFWTELFGARFNVAARSCCEGVGHPPRRQHGCEGCPRHLDGARAGMRPGIQRREI